MPSISPIQENSMQYGYDENDNNNMSNHPWAHLLDSPLPFCFCLFFPVFSFYLLHLEQHTELDNPIVMESLCYSANKKSEDAYDVSTSLTGYEPNVLTIGELNDSSVPISFMIPSTDQDVDDVKLGKMLTEAHRGQADYCDPEGVSVSQSSSSVVLDGSVQPDGERNVDQSVNFVTRNTYSAHSKFSENTQTEKMVDGSGKPDEQDSFSAQIRTLLEEQRQMIIAEYREKVGHHQLQQLTQKKSADFYKKNYGDRNWNFVKLINKVLQKWRNYENSKHSTFDTLARRKLIEDQNTILELSGRVQELQNDEVNCMNDSKDFQDAESVRSGNFHVTSRPVTFPPHPIPEGMLRHSFVSSRRKEGPPCIWDTLGFSGNVFANPDASSSAPYPQELHLWNSSNEEPLHTSTAEKSERLEQNQDLRCQSGPSAKDSVILSGGDSSKNCGADQQRLQISDLHFDKVPTPATFACWKIRFKTEVCTCSQFLKEAMRWIKEVELVDSVDEFRTSSSTRGISMPNFEVLDAKIASALNKIIHSSHFKRRISLEKQKSQKEDHFLRGRQIAYLIYDHFRVTGSHDSVENYTDLFTIVLQNDDIQEFDSKWDGILLSMTKIPHDDILEGLYKLRIRESEKLKTVLELFDLETHQKKLELDDHRLKTMVKRSIEQEIRNKNFGSRNGNFEKNAVVKNQGTKQRAQRIL